MCVKPVLENIMKGSTRIGTRQRPCGGCIGCRIDSMMLWSSRCNSEFIKYRSAFLTFTYDDNHLRYKDNQTSLFPSLCRDELHHYLDLLRHKVKKMSLPAGCIKDFKYFVCGEYGDTFKRPHYHALIFGLDFHDCKKLFMETWKNGSIKSLPILSGGVRYVVDYMSKKLTGEMAVKEFDDRGLERPFAFASNHLGFDFLFSHRDEICRNGFIKMGSRAVQVPSYYKNLFMDYNWQNVRSRLNGLVDSHKEVMREAKRNGFKDYDSYLNYKRKAYELNNATLLRSQGKPVRIINSDIYYNPSMIYEAFGV